MMEPSSTTGKTGSPVALSPEPSSTKANIAPASATTAAATTTGATTTAVPSSTTSATSTTGLQGASFKMPANVHMPKVLKDKTDDITQRIATTDIKRINGYMRFANLGAAILLAATCFIRMFMARSYSDFLVVIYIMYVSTDWIERISVA